MAAKILDGRKIAERINGETAGRVAKLKQETGRVPGLAAVLVGNDAASELYVSMKRRACEKAGVYSELHQLPQDVEQEELIVLLNNLNNDPKINGVLVQLPLPPQLDKARILDEISLEKDVDGLSSANLGKLASKQKGFVPATAKSVMVLVRETGEELKGKDVVVVGEGVLLGRPIAFILLNEWATLTSCHKYTKNLEEIASRADILVSAVGKPNLVTGEMVKEGAIVIDVGITELPGEDGRKKIVGDVDFKGVSQKASWITPVPGGVGPVTVAMLLQNTVEAFEKTID